MLNTNKTCRKQQQNATASSATSRIIPIATSATFTTSAHQRCDNTSEEIQKF